MTRRVIVCGSRRWHDREAISERLGALVNELAPDYPTIVHGGAHGADTDCG
jgi:predicted Rossmann fold nucleotide-binding protein DprA/Smf involved in DNA uptake